MKETKATTHNWKVANFDKSSNDMVLQKQSQKKTVHVSCFQLFQFSAFRFHIYCFQISHYMLSGFTLNTLDLK